MGMRDMDKAAKGGKPELVSRACRPYFADLSAYSDGELEGESRSAIEQHLLLCEACRLRLDQMIRLRYQALTVLATPGRPRSRSLLDLLKEKRDEEDTPAPRKPLVS